MAWFRARLAAFSVAVAVSVFLVRAIAAGEICVCCRKLEVQMCEEANITTRRISPRTSILQDLSNAQAILLMLRVMHIAGQPLRQSRSIQRSYQRSRRIGCLEVCRCLVH